MKIDSHTKKAHKLILFYMVSDAYMNKRIIPYARKMAV